MTNHHPSVLWHCWLGHQTCKNRRPYNLYCVGADVKPCSIKAWAHWTVSVLHIYQRPLKSTVASSQLGRSKVLLVAAWLWSVAVSLTYHVMWAVVLQLWLVLRYDTIRYDRRD